MSVSTVPRKHYKKAGLQSDFCWMPDHQHTPDEIKNVKQFIEKY